MRLGLGKDDPTVFEKKKRFHPYRFIFYSFLCMFSRLNVKKHIPLQMLFSSQ
jgi:hypothetical protein